MEQALETFVGRLGKKPELRYTPKQEPVCYLSVAINKGENEKPDWKQVVIWGRQEELASVQLDKGKEVFVQGKTVEKKYTDKQGQQKVFIEFKAKLIGFTNLY